MSNPNFIYELLLDYCDCDARIEQLLIGLVWTVCQTEDMHTGMAMSPGIPTRTLNWAGQLTGKSVNQLASWILSWEPYKATVAMAAINSCLNNRCLPESVTLSPRQDPANLVVFDYFLPQLRGKNVVVIGHYPGVERYQESMRLSVLEKQPNHNDFPDSACEFLIPMADWVFLTGSSIPNKTFPRLAELATHAKTVLMGPTVPWLPQLHEFGIDYLAGVEVVDSKTLYQTIAQGGGVRVFESGLRYRVAKLTPETSLAWLQQQISEYSSERLQPNEPRDDRNTIVSDRHFSDLDRTENADNRLDRLNNSFKSLSDKHRNAKLITGIEHE